MAMGISTSDINGEDRVDVRIFISIEYIPLAGSPRLAEITARNSVIKDVDYRESEDQSSSSFRV